MSLPRTRHSGKRRRWICPTCKPSHNASTKHGWHLQRQLPVFASFSLLFCLLSSLARPVISLPTFGSVFVITAKTKYSFLSIILPRSLFNSPSHNPSASCWSIFIRLPDYALWFIILLSSFYRFQATLLSDNSSPTPFEEMLCSWMFPSIISTAAWCNACWCFDQYTHLSFNICCSSFYLSCLIHFLSNNVMYDSKRRTFTVISLPVGNVTTEEQYFALATQKTSELKPAKPEKQGVAVSKGWSIGADPLLKGVRSLNNKATTVLGNILWSAPDVI